MKKLLTIITLFVSSFFFISLKEAKADITISEDINTYINDDFFVKRDYVKEFANKNGYEYLILRAPSYTFVFYNSDDVVTINSSQIKLSHFYLYSFQNDNTFKFINDYKNGSSWSLSITKILDSSSLIYPIDNFNIIYNNKSYIVGDSNPFVTLYDAYKDLNNIVEENPHQEEIDKLSNFYNVIIEKLSYLAEEIVSNYIYLSIIVIFILIFVFLLIFRRHL